MDLEMMTTDAGVFGERDRADDGRLARLAEGRAEADLSGIQAAGWELWWRTCSEPAGDRGGIDSSGTDSVCADGRAQVKDDFSSASLS